MAGNVIHACIANEINKKLKKDKIKMIIGSVAPDIPRVVGKNKNKSHFVTNNDSIPNLDLFLKKYKEKLNDDFVLGYYIHLYTDYLWNKNFLTKFIKNGYIYKKDGTYEVMNISKYKYVYDDYANTNDEILDFYKLDTSIFYNKLPNIPNIISEISMYNLELIQQKTKKIIEESKKDNVNVFDFEDAKEFITLAVNTILDDLKELGIIEN